MCAFSLHLWALILIFRDVSWVAERINMWDAIGVASYGLVLAFIESLIFLQPLHCSVCWFQQSGMRVVGASAAILVHCRAGHGSLDDNDLRLFGIEI